MSLTGALGTFQVPTQTALLLTLGTIPAIKLGDLKCPLTESISTTSKLKILIYSNLPTYILTHLDIKGFIKTYLTQMLNIMLPLAGKPEVPPIPKAITIERVIIRKDSRYNYLGEVALVMDTKEEADLFHLMSTKGKVSPYKQPRTINNIKYPNNPRMFIETMETRKIMNSMGKGKRKIKELARVIPYKIC